MTPAPGSPRSPSEEAQRQHHDRLADLYEAHYGDAWSLRYRDLFINQPLTRGLAWKGARTLDAMCGNGESTHHLLQLGAEVTGLDISPAEIERFRLRFPNCPAVCGSILETGLPGGSFDAVVSVGGLHHLPPHIPEAIREIHRLLRPGGHFCFMDPHRGSLPDFFRRCWYRCDRMFADNEAAIDLTALADSFAKEFEVVSVQYNGGLGHLFVLNSMIFRVPARWKGFYSPALLRLERICQPLFTRRLSCVAICQWRKRA